MNFIVARVIRIAVAVASVSLLFLIGWKGIVGILFGISVFAYALFTKNPILQTMIERTQSQAYAGMLRGEDEEEDEQGSYRLPDEKEEVRAHEERHQDS